MTDLLRSLVLGIIQGLTEFLPVSSSGHLEIAKFILGEDAVGEESLLLTVVLHFATALSTIVIFRSFIWQLVIDLFKPKDQSARRYALLIVVSMIPAALVGVFFNDFIESLFSKNILLVCLMLLVTGGLLLIADRAKTTQKGIHFSDALLIGISQAIAILPGISRSGATISTSVILGIDREESARFSFLMVIPLIFGKMAKDILDGTTSSLTTISTGELLIGFVGAFITGLLACTWMIQLVKRSNLKYFSYYCFTVACLGILLIIMM